jgi:4-amino-4-deoxy-L-arabinose transferase-like glycosyltransferase
MASPRIRPPFAWLGQYAAVVSVVTVTAIAAFFRFYQITSLPPGLYDSSARTGLQALNLLEHGTLPGLDAANGYAPLWVWFQAVSIKLLGHTELALRLWPALLGTLAVVTTWLWLRSWFSLRIAWLGSFLVAVTPWAITLSRNGFEAAAYPLLVTLTLWLGTRAWQRAGLRNYVLAAAMLVLDLLTGPIGWLLTATVLIIGAILLARRHQLLSLTRERIAATAVVAAGLAGLGYLIGISLEAVKALPRASSLTANLGNIGSNLVQTLLMFNVHGDENYRHNLAGEPLLNVFVGLMLVAGLLVGISRLHQQRYRLLLALLAILLLPAILTTASVPNAARAAAALPLVLALAAIGISYMLELWYATFPINSAARATGQAAIIILLALTAFQGYTQYFHAWAGSSEVYTAYNEGAVQLAHNLTTQKFTGQRYLLAPADQLSVVSYLSHNQTAYQVLDTAGLTALPVATGGRQFLIAAASRDAAVKVLKVKFPGGVLRPHYSSFNQTEIYYTYEITQ